MRALIVDDSAEDRLNLRVLLERCPGVEVVGEASQLADARRLLSDQGVDLLFLDIQLGRENGFELLKALPSRPQVIVTTVHRQYGVQAFDLDVADYVVKPVSEDRLQRAIERAGRSSPAHRAAHDVISVHRSGSARRMLMLDSIVAVVGDDKYSRVFAGDLNLPDHRTLREWEKLLAEHGFTRIDRSTLVNGPSILAVQPIGRGARLSFHQTSTEIDVGRAGRERLGKIFPISAR